MLPIKPMFDKWRQPCLEKMPSPSLLKTQKTTKLSHLLYILWGGWGCVTVTYYHCGGWGCDGDVLLWGCDGDLLSLGVV